MYKEDFDKLDIEQVNRVLEDAQVNSLRKGIILLNTLIFLILGTFFK